MGFDLLLALWIAYYMTRNTVQDLVFKATGELPPSYLREQERIKAKRARRPITTRREARRFWVNAWDDAWEAAEERRARANTKRGEFRRARWAQLDVNDVEDEAYRRNADQDASTRPAINEPAVPEPHTPEPGTPQLPGPEPSRPYDPQEVPDGTRPQSIPWPAEPVDVDQPGQPQGARIIQLNAWHAPQAPVFQEDPTVSETTNLNAALAYTQTMGDNARQGVASVEQSIASLTAGGVTGATITALFSAQEGLSAVAAQFEAAHAALVRHVSVQEAYAANRDAGHRQFVTSD